MVLYLGCGIVRVLTSPNTMVINHDQLRNIMINQDKSPDFIMDRQLSLRVWPDSAVVMVQQGSVV